MASTLVNIRCDTAARIRSHTSTFWCRSRSCRATPVRSGRGMMSQSVRRGSSKSEITAARRCSGVNVSSSPSRRPASWSRWRGPRTDWSLRSSALAGGIPGTSDAWVTRGHRRCGGSCHVFACTARLHGPSSRECAVRAAPRHGSTVSASESTGVDHGHVPQRRRGGPLRGPAPLRGVEPSDAGPGGIGDRRATGWPSPTTSRAAGFTRAPLAARPPTSVWPAPSRSASRAPNTADVG